MQKQMMRLINYATQQRLLYWNVMMSSSVASVSCIYGIGDPQEYKSMMVSIRVGMEMERNELLNELVRIQYQRNDIDFHRGTFRVRGDVVENPSDCD